MANVPAYFPLPATSRRIAMVSGGFLVVLGVMVLSGWYLGIPRLMQLHPTFVAMQFNTAVGFTLAGVTLLTGARGWMGVSRTSAFFVSLLGVLTLAAYLGGWNFGFETWLWKLGVDQTRMAQYTITKLSAPGRLAPNTALAFALFGIAIALAGTRGNGRMLAGAVLGTLILGIGTIALFGYIGGTATAYGWGRLTRMAIHTAMGATVAGAGVVALSMAYARSKQSERVMWLRWLVLVAGAVVSIGLWQATADYEFEQLERTTALGASTVRNEIAIGMKARTEALTRMARRWDFFGRPTQEVWKFDTEMVHADFKGYQGIAWVDTSNVIRWIAPERANEAALGFDVRRDPRRAEAMEQASERKEVVFSRVVELAVGGRGMVAFIPVSDRGRADGYIYATFRIGPLLQTILASDHQDAFGMAVLDGEERLFATDSANATLGEPWLRKERVDLPGGTWGLNVWPGRAVIGAARSNEPKLMLVVGLAFDTAGVGSSPGASRWFTQGGGGGLEQRAKTRSGPARARAVGAERSGEGVGEIERGARAVRVRCVARSAGAASHGGKLHEAPCETLQGKVGFGCRRVHRICRGRRDSNAAVDTGSPAFLARGLPGTQAGGNELTSIARSGHSEFAHFH